MFAFLLQKLGNIEGNLDDFKVSVSNETILNEETKTSLTNLTNSSVDQINFDQFFNEVGDLYQERPLQPLIQGPGFQLLCLFDVLSAINRLLVMLMIDYDHILLGNVF